VKQHAISRFVAIKLCHGTYNAVLSSGDRPATGIYGIAVGFELSGLELETAMSDRFFDEQALRLLRAFFAIKDQSARELIIALAEAAARGRKISAYPVDADNEPKSN